jgi:hypothetical protein
MSKFRGRVDRLYKKTHTFISFDEYRIHFKYCEYNLKSKGIDPVRQRAEVEDFKKKLSELCSTKSEAHPWIDKLIESNPIGSQVYQYEMSLETFQLGVGKWLDKKSGNILKVAIAQMRKELQNSTAD